MHPEAFAWVRKHARSAAHVVECGSRDINGSVRPLFGCDRYTGVDVVNGPGVDVVADFADWKPDTPVDAVVCCEVLEHAETAEALVTHALDMLEPGGRLIVTAAANPRTPHSAVDGGALRDGEWYQNIDPADLRRWLSSASWSTVEHNTDAGDVYAVAVK